MRAIDLCAGAGGLSLGLQRARFDVMGVELDADACATHRANVGPCEQASIVGWHPPQPADLVAGGVPCQPYSIAGKRAGTESEDGRLYLELIRVAVEADAGAVLLENVEGMTTWRDGDGWGVVARIEEAMRVAGYEPRRMVLCAADYGTPQLRYRLFIVGFRDPRALAAWRWPTPTHADAPNLFGLLPWVTVRQALGLGGGRYSSGRRDGAKGWQGERKLDVDAPSTTVKGGSGADLLDRPVHTIGAGGTRTGGFEPLMDADYSRRFGEALAKSMLDRPAPTITSTDASAARDPDRASRRPIAELRHQLGAAGLLDRPSTTIDGAGGRAPKAGHHDRQQRGAVRLTPEQCAILQGFPLEFTFAGLKGSRGRQAGNAVPPRLGEAVGRSIYRALAAVPRG